jgi:hypothetical protein
MMDEENSQFVLDVMLIHYRQDAYDVWFVCKICSRSTPEMQLRGGLYAGTALLAIAF